MESVPKITIFGLKMMMKSGLEKILLKFLHEEAISIWNIFLPYVLDLIHPLGKIFVQILIWG